MAQRICAHCGKIKDLAGGKICEKDHFLCKDCVVRSTIFTTTVFKKCPICGTLLR